jgi:hypothetical protein
MKKINCVKIMGIITTIVVSLSIGIVGTDVERINEPLYTYTSNNKTEEVRDDATTVDAIPTIAPIISTSYYDSIDESDSSIEYEESESSSEETEENESTNVKKSIYVGSQDLRFSYMDWRTITDQTSDQWKLQNWYSITDWTTGIRTVNGRYSVAVGSTVSVEKGRYIDVYLENGTIIPCVISDTKADYDTWGNEGIVGNDGSVIEFIVDTDVMSVIDIGSVSDMGDYKYLSDDWNSPVDHIDVLTYGQDID